jgi:anti-sigma-K factor RskA
MMQGAHIPQEDLILYAMQALSEGETAAVRLHLEDCKPCREEIAAVSGDLALLALSVEQHPLPDGARQRFVDRISTATSPMETKAPVVAIDTARPGRKAALWISWLAVAALLVTAISLGFQVRSLNEELRRKSEEAAKQEAESSRAKQVLEVLTAPSAKRVLLTASKAKPAPTARAVYLAESGGLILQANDLEQLAQDKTYELWVIPANGQAPIPAGLFRPDAAGSASVVLPPLPKGVPAKAFGVTIEKAEGSATPTAPILLAGAVPTSGE